MTHDELVERVARAIAGDDGDWWEDYSLYAKRAIAVVLEEAAKVAEQSPDSHWGPTIAAEIRKLKGDA